LKTQVFLILLLLAIMLAGCSKGCQAVWDWFIDLITPDSPPPAQNGGGGGTVPPPTETPPPTPTEPPTEPPVCEDCTPPPNSTPMLTSGYYIPTESQARERDGGILYPVPAPTWVEDKDTYLVRYDQISAAEAAGVAWSKNWVDGFPAQYANEGLLYDYNYTCLQGSGKLDESGNGHYIACDTNHIWNNFLPDNVSHLREDLIGFRWANESEGSLLASLVPFHTVAVCDTSTLHGTIQLLDLPEDSMNKLRDHGNPDAVFQVTDIGQGLCPKNSSDGNARVDIFTGEGKQAYLDAILFFDKSVQVVQR